MNKSEEQFELRFRPREVEKVSIEIPVSALDSLQKVAAGRDMSCQALIKFYVGQGLRQDLSKLYADRVLDRTAEVLARHIQSKDEVSTILREIREVQHQSGNGHKIVA